MATAPARNSKSAISASQQKDDETYAAFIARLKAREQVITESMPETLNPKAFLNAVALAFRKTPKLLECTEVSIDTAISQAAQDGLYPNSREGHFSWDWDDRAKVLNCGWRPMILGIRKRASELGGINIDAQVVHQGDYFKRFLGDNPRYEHEPADDNKRGDMIGAYAIFRRSPHVEDIVHREYMSAEQIAKVKGKSRQQGSDKWTTFAEEGWKITVTRRGAKSIPYCIHPDLMRIIQRVDQDYEFDRVPEPQQQRTPPSAAAAEPQPGRAQDEPKPENRRTPPPAEKPRAEPPATTPPSGQDGDNSGEAWTNRAVDTLKNATLEKAFEVCAFIEKAAAKSRVTEGQHERVATAFKVRMRQIFTGKNKAGQQMTEDDRQEILSICDTARGTKIISEKIRSWVLDVYDALAVEMDNSREAA